MKSSTRSKSIGSASPSRVDRLFWSWCAARYAVSCCRPWISSVQLVRICSTDTRTLHDEQIGGPIRSNRWLCVNRVCPHLNRDSSTSLSLLRWRHEDQGFKTGFITNIWFAWTLFHCSWRYFENCIFVRWRISPNATGSSSGSGSIAASFAIESARSFPEMPEWLSSKPCKDSFSSSDFPPYIFSSCRFLSRAFSSGIYFVLWFFIFRQLFSYTEFIRLDDRYRHLGSALVSALL